MTRSLALSVLLSCAAAAEESAVPVQVQEQPGDPGKPSEALKVFEKKPTPEEKRVLDAANPDPWRASVPIVAGGAAALVLPFAAWFAFKRFKGD